MSKKKKIMIGISVLASIMVSFMGGQTFSKYVSEVRGNGIAEVATWDFKVNGQRDEVQNIDLASTCDNQTLVGNKIAPGTSGNFQIVIDGSGTDVGIDYKIKFLDESQKPNNLKFIYDNQIYHNISELESVLSGTIKADEETETKTRISRIHWKWDYETGTNEEEIKQNDKLDTQDAQNISNYTFKVNVSGTQIVPETEI